MLIKNESLWQKMKKNREISDCSFEGTIMSFENNQEGERIDRQHQQLMSEAISIYEEKQ